MSAVRAALLLAAMGVAGCRPKGPAAPVATDHVELPPSYKFVPANITVRAGTPVTWTNHDHFTHSIRLLDDGRAVMVMRPDSSATFTFSHPGTHRFDCSFHPHDMHGVVVVTAP